MTFFKTLIIIILTLASCKNRTQKNEEQELKEESNYSSLAEVCFTQKYSASRNESFRLGDSLIQVIKFIDLDTTFGPSYPLKSPIVETKEHGTCAIKANANFKSGLLDSFNATWEYTCDTTKEARIEFFNFITHHAMRCFWEDGPNTYKNQDTLHSAFIDNRYYELITDLRTNPWKAKFTYRTKK